LTIDEARSRMTIQRSNFDESLVDVIVPIYTDLEKEGFHLSAGAGPGTNNSVYFNLDFMIGPFKVYFTYDEDPNQQAVICAKYPLGLNAPEMAQLRKIIRIIERTTVPKRGVKVKILESNPSSLRVLLGRYLNHGFARSSIA
jgi:hypothetical protein